MKHWNRFRLLIILPVALWASLFSASHVRAATAKEINRDSRAALQQLYNATPAARRAGESASGVLVFPAILKAGFLVGAHHGEGTLFSRGKTLGYYRTTAASYGLQAGVQKFGYALFFMTASDLDYLRKSGGWEIGTGPSVVVVLGIELEGHSDVRDVTAALFPAADFAPAFHDRDSD